MRLAVIGSKGFNDYSVLKAILDGIPNIAVIISGAAAGTDTLAARYAGEQQIELLEFPPDYEKFGDDAKHQRDRLIVENCDLLIAFWDGKCEGTKYTLNYAGKLKIPMQIIDISDFSSKGTGNRM